MGNCFVIQPFDKGKFDKRFDDVLVPAITSTGLEAYRVDRDPNVSIPIEDIQSGIESSVLCLADITTDNPNVWFELGYAIASRKSVILICSEERESKFPFDVQHRTIVRYKSDSPRDFEELKSNIRERINAALKKDERLENLAQTTSIAPVEGLEQFELAVLVAIAEQLQAPEDSTSLYPVKESMKRAGFTDIATTLGLRGLLVKEMLETMSCYDERNDADYTGYRLLDKGLDWLLHNKDKLILKRQPTPPETPSGWDEMPF